MRNSEKFLEQLKPEIKEKCNELRLRKKEKKLKRIFVLSAILLFSLPVLLVIAGYSFRSAFLAVILLEIAMLLINVPDMITVFRGENNYGYRQNAV